MKMIRTEDDDDDDDDDDDLDQCHFQVWNQHKLSAGGMWDNGEQ